jgi:hypothetical protein
MTQRILPVDRDALLRAVTARGESLLGTWLELADGSLHALVEHDESAEGRAFEARMDAHPDGFAKVPVYPREYRLMTEFVETVESDPLAAALDAALAGREAFRRFDAVLAAHPDEAGRWGRYRSDALLAWASAWLRAQGIDTPWTTEPPRPERPATVELLVAGGPVTRACADRHEARDLFVRLCRELCDLVREPFRASDVRGRTRFARAGVQLDVDGASVTVRPAG